jgi:hypothetical protein
MRRKQSQICLAFKAICDLLNMREGQSNISTLILFCGSHRYLGRHRDHLDLSTVPIALYPINEFLFVLHRTSVKNRYYHY